MEASARGRGWGAAFQGVGGGWGGRRGGRSRSLGLGTSERLTKAIPVTLQTSLHREIDNRRWDGAGGRRCYSWYVEGVGGWGGAGDTLQGSGWDKQK